MTKLVVAFRNFAKAPNNQKKAKGNVQDDSLARGPKLLSNAEHKQMQVTGRVQYIAGGGSMLFSIVAGMCM